MLGATTIEQCFIILPVNLLYFKTELYEKCVWVTWATASETDNDRFELERSSNGQDFSTIGILKGAGTSINTIQYHFSDFFPSPGTNFYRLKQFDRNGRIKVSQVRTVNYLDKNELAVYTNLSANLLIIQKTNRFPLQIRVYNSAGQLVIQKSSLENRTNIDIAKFNSGIYNVVIQMNGKNSISKFIK